MNNDLTAACVQALAHADSWRSADVVSDLIQLIEREGGSFHP